MQLAAHAVQQLFNLLPVIAPCRSCECSNAERLTFQSAGALSKAARVPGAGNTAPPCMKLAVRRASKDESS